MFSRIKPIFIVVKILELIFCFFTKSSGLFAIIIFSPFLYFIPSAPILVDIMLYHRPFLNNFDPIPPADNKGTIIMSFSIINFEESLTSL